MASESGLETLRRREATEALCERLMAVPLAWGRLQMVTEAAGRRPVVLVVEDDASDTDLIRWAFEECRGQVELRFVETIEKAIDWLSQSKRSAGSNGTPRPSLVLLDLNLPKGNGHRLLRIIRDDVVLRTIPVVVFTGSDSEADIARAYELGANSYFTKPDTMDGFRSIIRIIEAYWLRKVELPPPLG